MPPTLPNTLTNGTTADASQVMANFNAINAAVDQSTVTSLPGSPYDGQEVYYLADAANGVVWHLKYRAASGSAYKWEYVGGSELISEINAAEGRSAATYGALTTAGPSITVPLAGDYDVTVGAEMFGNGSGIAACMSYDVGATPAVEADRAIHLEPTTGNSSQSTHWRQRRKVGLASSTALAAKYRSSGTGTSTFDWRNLRVRPVRVG